MNSRRFHSDPSWARTHRKDIGWQWISQRVWKASRREAQDARPADLGESSLGELAVSVAAILLGRQPVAHLLISFARQGAGGVKLSTPGSKTQARGFSSPLAMSAAMARSSR
jgi:hypothetical protein